MYIQSITAQVQYLTIQRSAVSAAESGDDNEAQQSVQSPVAKFDRVELSTWAISISRQTTGLIGAGETPDVDPGSDKPKSPRELIADLRESINTLKENGVLSERQARHLNRILDVVTRALDNGRSRPAARLMRHFAWRAERMADHGRIPQEAGSELVDSAREVSKQLKSDWHDRVRNWRKPVPESSSITLKAGVMLLYSELQVATSR